MIRCVLGETTYVVDFVSGRALREMQPAQDALSKLREARVAAEKGEAVPNMDVSAELDKLVKWFCVLFGNQFKPDEMYDHYPSDKFLQDITLAIIAVNAGVSDALSEFPTKAARNS